MEILYFFQTEHQDHWLKEIGKSDWGAGVYLHDLLASGDFRKLCGADGEVLLLTEGEKLISFCTFVWQDDVQDPTVTPWAGFVYTFPQYRGHRYMGLLLARAYELAKKQGAEYLHISTNEIGLYETYGYTYWRQMKDREGEPCRVYRRKVE